MANRTKESIKVASRSSAANKKHPPMAISERAKQFNPFSAVSGLEAALRKKEREMGLVDKKELSDEATCEINRTLTMLKAGDYVNIKYYENGEYLTVSGDVKCILDTDKMLVVGDFCVSINNILKIEKI